MSLFQFSESKMLKWRIKVLKNIRRFKRQCSNMHENENKPRYNPINIQMLSDNLHSQIFDQKNNCDPELVSNCINHLKRHKLWNKKIDYIPDVSFDLPVLQGKNISEHFQNIAQMQSNVYKKHLENLAFSSIPTAPKVWNFSKGWTKYDANGNAESISFPKDDALLFDVEVCMTEGCFPTLATAVSPEAWYLYSWCSPRLLEDSFSSWNETFSISDLIPLETCSGEVKPPGGRDWSERILVGHNVSFDRSFIKEQYLIEGTKTRFFDTMSMHIAVSGQTSSQRDLTIAHKAGTIPKPRPGMKFNPKKTPLSVDKQIIKFVPVAYEIYGTRKQRALIPYPLFMACPYALNIASFPNPVTFAGMLEMSTAYLPINHNWSRYIQDCQETSNDLTQELKQSLMHVANEACHLYHDEKYKEDLFLWDLDWSTKDLKIKKIKESKTKRKKSKVEFDEEVSSVINSDPTPDGNLKSMSEDIGNEMDEEAQAEINRILKTSEYLYKIRPLLPAYPRWYADMCTKPIDEDDEYVPGPHLISLQQRTVPKLMRLTWDGFPLHYDKTHGWGYLVPGRSLKMNDVPEEYAAFPVKQMAKHFCKIAENSDVSQYSLSDPTERHIQELFEKMKETAVNNPEDSYSLWKYLNEINSLIADSKTKKVSKAKKKPHDSDAPSFHQGNGPYTDVKVPDCWFFRLPHKDGPSLKVGNPLSKDFLSKLEGGTLKSYAGLHSEKALKLSIILSYWKNNKKRIQDQMVVALNHKELPQTLISSPDYDENGFYGAIIPRIVFAGTVTRRAVEKTWLTASNANPNRLGSELKSMIQAPPGYHFIGADVDSQELWIAALFGDASFANMHGGTALGWMTLQGKKSEGTDMHSRTAETIGISRDKAKVVNYGRIYGAGLKFAETLLKQFNHRISPEEAKAKAKKMYEATKGVRIVKNKKVVWVGGRLEDESEMFNKLEAVALSDEPKTPVLNCRISRALEPAAVKDTFITSRVNWVVQSSAVDYLHLMLVNMKWLFEKFNIEGRFCISIHDEVRYLVKSEDRYRAALALQITNLYTRAMFSYMVGIHDLPQGVAFFSTVDVDTVLRKEVDMDCQTPSNSHGMLKGYNIPPGEALDIFKILEYTDNGCLDIKHTEDVKACGTK
ncbi:DNA polymerase subunit gamma-1 [Nymphon striatum]|nr:DNA polymerase subunit gamma-1 [Nymphon striatum]